MSFLTRNAITVASFIDLEGGASVNSKLMLSVAFCTVWRGCHRCLIQHPVGHDLLFSRLTTGIWRLPTLDGSMRDLSRPAALEKRVARIRLVTARLLGSVCSWWRQGC